MKIDKNLTVLLNSLLNCHKYKTPLRKPWKDPMSLKKQATSNIRHALRPPFTVKGHLSWSFYFLYVLGLSFHILSK